jgi:transglutaminase-like putative cysteine protease
MHIRYGFDVALDLAQPATILAMMDVHSDFRPCVAEETELELAPLMSAERFVDDSGNIVRRLSTPAGTVSLRLQGVSRSDGREDEVGTDAEAVAAPNLPQDTLPFLRPSRYCETDLLADFAWANFGAITGGWPRVQAIWDFVHQRLRFSYPEARPNTHRKRSLGGRRWRVPRLHPSGGGVVSLCQYSGALLQRLSRRHRRPARSSADGFNAWFEAFLGDRWFTFDARHNQPRIGRILISRGRDAADIAMITTLGSHRLTRFAVVTEEIKERASVAA